VAPRPDSGRQDSVFAGGVKQTRSGRTVELGAVLFTSTAVGDLVSWSVDTDGHVFPAHGGAADEPYPHVIMDRGGVEWTVREVETPQPWARGERCLVLNSRECVRRLWRYPPDWRTLDADDLLELGTAD
jgi:hypothetical protein